MRLATCSSMLIAAILAAGCTGGGRDALRPASSQTRADRRAFRGAPPVIPHPPLSGTCISCHTPTGRAVPDVGMAPANPHLKTAGLGDHARCKQCHVFRQTDDLFADSEFTAWRAERRDGEKAHPLAPPTIPHPLFMREDCAACHSGPSARPEVVCRHAERLRCQQCHVPQTTLASAPGDS